LSGASRLTHGVLITIRYASGKMLGKSPVVLPLSIACRRLDFLEHLISLGSRAHPVPVPAANEALHVEIRLFFRLSPLSLLSRASGVGTFPSFFDGLLIL